MTNDLEIRIHGVSGTPPESMLNLSAMPSDGSALGPGGHGPFPCANRGAEDEITLHEHPPGPPHDVEAYSWGALTSARRGTALYLLLLPFVLANVAGWTMQPSKSRPSIGGKPRPWMLRAHIFVVRLAGLLLTGLMVVALHFVVVDLAAWQWAAQRHADNAVVATLTPTGVLMVGYALVLALVGVLWCSTRIRPRKRPPWEREEDDESPDEWQDLLVDPAGYVWPDEDPEKLWTEKGVIERLRTIHLVVAMSVLGALAVYATGTAGGWLLSLALAPALPAIVLLAAISFGDGARPPARPDATVNAYIALGAVALALLVVALVYAGLHVPATATGEDATATLLRGPRGALGLGSGAYVFVLIVLMAVQCRAHRDAPAPVPGRSRYTATSFLLIAVAIVVGLGAGLGLALVRQVEAVQCSTTDLAGCPLRLGEGIQWLAVAYLVSLALLLIVAAIFYAIGLWRNRKDRGSRPMQALRYMTTATGATTQWAFVIGMAVIGALTAIAAPQLWTEGSLLPVRQVPLVAALVTYVLVALGVVVAVAAIGVLVWFVLSGRWLRAVLLAAGAALAVVVYLRTDATFRVLGFPLPPRSMIDAAVFVGLVAPVTLLLTRIVSAYRQREVRRGVGVLWDLGLFWPRWFHPFAPPAYAHLAVTWLASRVSAVLAASETRRVVLSAHSQGSLLATSALMLLNEHEYKRVALVTYGSPWGRLYGELFPAQFGREALRALLTRLGWNGTDTVRWRNMHRATDPIGGPIVSSSQPWLHADDLNGARAVVDPHPEVGCADSCDDNDDRRLRRPMVHSGYTLEQYYGDLVDQALASFGYGDVEDESQVPDRSD